ncbi:MAG: hypothetical protein MI923_16250 [Phycisphaerales bacterium]|nr:hypothetical protein [Phycisphaerales bacterium]
MADEEVLIPISIVNDFERGLRDLGNQYRRLELQQQRMHSQGRVGARRLNSAFRQNIQTSRQFERSLVRGAESGTRAMQGLVRTTLRWSTIAGTAAVGAGTLLLKQGIGLNAEFEKYRLTLETVQRSQAKANADIAWIIRFAKTTPFEVQGLAETTAQLEAFGLNARKWLPLVGDLAAAFGGTEEKVQQLVRAISFLRTGASGEAFETLRRVGISRSEFESRGIEFDKGGQLKSDSEEALDALADIIQTRFGGMMDRLSRTFTGTISNIKDTATNSLREVTGPLFDSLTEEAQAFLKQLEEFERTGVTARVTDELGQFLNEAFKSAAAFSKSEILQPLQEGADFKDVAGNLFDQAKEPAAEFAVWLAGTLADAFIQSLKKLASSEEGLKALAVAGGFHFAPSIAGFGAGIAGRGTRGLIGRRASAQAKAVSTAASSAISAGATGSTAAAAAKRGLFAADPSIATGHQEFLLGRFGTEPKGLGSTGRSSSSTKGAATLSRVSKFSKFSKFLGPAGVALDVALNAPDAAETFRIRQEQERSLANSLLGVAGRFSPTFGGLDSFFERQRTGESFFRSGAVALRQLTTFGLSSERPVDTSDKEQEALDKIGSFRFRFKEESKLSKGLFLKFEDDLGSLKDQFLGANDEIINFGRNAREQIIDQSRHISQSIKEILEPLRDPEDRISSINERIQELIGNEAPGALLDIDPNFKATLGVASLVQDPLDDLGKLKNLFKNAQENQAELASLLIEGATSEFSKQQTLIKQNQGIVDRFGSAAQKGPAEVAKFTADIAKAFDVQQRFLAGQDSGVSAAELSRLKQFDIIDEKFIRQHLSQKFGEQLTIQGRSDIARLLEHRGGVDSTDERDALEQRLERINELFETASERNVQVIEEVLEPIQEKLPEALKDAMGDAFSDSLEIFLSKIGKQVPPALADLFRRQLEDAMRRMEDNFRRQQRENIEQGEFNDGSTGTPLN